MRVGDNRARSYRTGKLLSSLLFSSVRNHALTCHTTGIDFNNFRILHTAKDKTSLKNLRIS